MTGLPIALDVMGGDRAPEMVLRGADIARTRTPELKFILCGAEQRIAPLLEAAPGLRAVSTIIHTDDVVAPDAKPSAAIRRAARHSSMRYAIDAVAEGRAGAAVSAGNTGALMAIAVTVLKTLPGIHRPAIASFLPTRRGESVLLDLGANVECDADNLVEFALMGDAFARTVLGYKKPTIGLLNVGSEELKGNDAVREAYERLKHRAPGLAFHGFVEGDDIAAGTVDVVVTDGFTGNVALKTAEGIVKLYAEFLRGAFQSSFMARIGYLFAKAAIARMKERADPRRYNGAMLLGLNGIVVKSHGGSDEVGFANAINAAHDMDRHGLLDRIKSDMDCLSTSSILAQAASG